ncbi:hypothetical protein GmHk_U059728 [Glycine max]|nr:hypothetical protein GmHk_U059728 [Glycine max]
MEAEETQEAAATPERSLEAASEPLAQGEDLPSPQPVADPSTPVLDLSEGQTTPVLTLNTSPPTTPVLHLTDEEDGQTQLHKTLLIHYLTVGIFEKMSGVCETFPFPKALLTHAF